MIRKFQSCYIYIFVCAVQPYFMDGFGDWKATLEENLI